MLKLRSEPSESWNPFAVELQRQSKLSGSMNESAIEDRLSLAQARAQQARLDRLTSQEINRLIHLPSHLARQDADSHEDLIVKNVLSRVVQEVVRQDGEQGWHRAILARLHNNKSGGSRPPMTSYPRVPFETTVQAPRPTSPSIPAIRRYFTLRQIEEEVQPHVERLKAEINKRRYRLEIDCANQLGLATPWKRTRYRRPVMMDEEYGVGVQKTMVNPLDISLHPDGMPAMKSEPDDAASPQNADFGVKSPHRGYDAMGSPMHDRADVRKEGVIRKVINKPEAKNPRGRPRKNPLHTEAEAKRLKKAKREACVEQKLKLVCAKCAKLCDERRFHVACAACEQRCHGRCVGLTEKRARKLPHWTCDECGGTEPKEALYCVCRKPYDESLFYVGCDGCEDWFHPECVGTTQKQVESTNAGYLCPNCAKDELARKERRGSQPDGDASPAQALASRNEFPLLWRLLDVLVNNQHSWPFRNPVDREKLPRYYEIVHRPMDLSTMRRKLENNEYQNLKSFVADSCLIFDNARQFYVKQNEIYQCADQLEKVFRAEIVRVSRDVDGHRSRVPSVLDIETDQLLGFGSDCNVDPTQFLQDLL